MKASTVVVPIAPAIELRQILFATDFSDASLAALPLVSKIAHRYGSRVFVMNVSTPIAYAMVSPEAAAALQHRDELHARSKVKDLLKTADLAGLSTTVVVRSGIPTDELDHFVREHKIDLAILGTHGRTGMKHLVMGSVAEDLFRHLPCPVLTVGPNISKPAMQAIDVRHILFPTDLSDESQAVFPYLASLASQYKASLTLASCLAGGDGHEPGCPVPGGTFAQRNAEYLFSSHGSRMLGRVHNRLWRHRRAYPCSCRIWTCGPHRSGRAEGWRGHNAPSQYRRLPGRAASTLPGTYSSLFWLGEWKKVGARSSPRIESSPC